MAVYIELAAGDTLLLGKSRLRLERKSGQRARLMIDSPDDVERVKAGDPLPARALASAPTTATATPFLKQPSFAAK